MGEDFKLTEFERVLDFHTHVGEGRMTSFSVSQLGKAMSESGVTDAIIFPFGVEGPISETKSLKLVKEVEYFPNLFQFLRFDPKTMTPERLSELLPLFYGVKLHSKSENFDPINPTFFPLYDVIANSGKPLLFHTMVCNYQNTHPDRIVAITDEIPDLVLVLAHFCDCFPGLLDKIKTNDNIYLETSLGRSSPYSICSAVDKIGEDRILFGSDAPYGDQLIERLNVERTKLSYKQKEKILYRNAARLLGL
ncbi:amidohydrolase family protein [Candidatus Woesearchaeota archaeon]|jgi:uncharacterized protein|nr:amidohydrolase family protein [Candidatus Woesearchaeota archaeon]MBT5272205.1 amidohydrolase family protein [Candidatus Woesearchaeota archaeon]MBT6041549.1 amidohydrolase family protein [Candidatus Woesearchaeota archaeon]MBT6336911.1 amidohydrolase family protein [Candidatus Woesearchaeota archaeon]MBT7927781.1 amidohydrolase family protein [Candidatus Woesearchaeota archaeon]